MKVRWSETALAEIEDIFSYIYERNRSAAVAVVERIEGLTTLLEEFPLIGHTTDEAEVRVLSVVRYPFLIFYAIDPAGAG
jgi:plasmid stabilization system protein ParE